MSNERSINVREITWTTYNKFIFSILWFQYVKTLVTSIQYVNFWFWEEGKKSAKNQQKISKKILLFLIDILLIKSSFQLTRPLSFVREWFNSQDTGTQRKINCIGTERKDVLIGLRKEREKKKRFEIHKQHASLLCDTHHEYFVINSPPNLNLDFVPRHEQHHNRNVQSQ